MKNLTTRNARFLKLSLFVSLMLGVIGSAQATTVNLQANGQWNEFSVDDFSSQSQGVEWIDLSDSNSPNFGTALSYQFSIAAGFSGVLSVVDAGFAGDIFEVFNNGQSLGTTSLTNNSISYSNDFDTNMAWPVFSSNRFFLSEGNYEITGALFSTLQGFNATNGALKLDVAPVPLPGALLLMLSGLGLLGIGRKCAA